MDSCWILALEMLRGFRLDSKLVLCAFWVDSGSTDVQGTCNKLCTKATGHRRLRAVVREQKKDLYAWPHDLLDDLLGQHLQGLLDLVPDLHPWDLNGLLDVLNLIVDILQAWLNPRMRMQ